MLDPGCPAHTQHAHSECIRLSVHAYREIPYVRSYRIPPQVHRDITSGNVLLTATASGGGGRAGGRAGQLRAMARSCPDMQWLRGLRLLGFRVLGFYPNTLIQWLRGLVLMSRLRLMPTAGDCHSIIK